MHDIKDSKMMYNSIVYRLISKSRYFFTIFVLVQQLLKKYWKIFIVEIDILLGVNDLLDLSTYCTNGVWKLKLVDLVYAIKNHCVCMHKTFENLCQYFVRYWHYVQ